MAGAGACLVAIVDDEPQVGKALRRLLRSAGLEAEAFASGAEFLPWLAEHRPDCVVLDIHMPEMSGFKLQERLEADHPGLPCVFITAVADPEEERHAAAHRVPLLHKPFTEAELLAAVRCAPRR